MTVLQADKAFIENFSKYLDDADVFLANFAIRLLKYNSINHYVIKFLERKQFFYKLIYNLNSIKLETLKTYIETYQK